MILNISEASVDCPFFSGTGWYFFGVNNDVYGPYTDRYEVEHDNALYLNEFFNYCKEMEERQGNKIVTPDDKIILTGDGLGVQS